MQKNDIFFEIFGKIAAKRGSYAFFYSTFASMKTLTDTEYIHALIAEGEHQQQDFKFEISDARKIAKNPFSLCQYRRWKTAHRSER